MFNYWLLHGNGVETKWKFNCPICCRAFASRFHYWPPPAVAMSHHRSSVRPTILHSNYINKEIAYFSISLKTYWCYSIVTQRQTHFIRLYRNVKVPEIDVIAASIYVRLFYSTQSSFYTQRIRNVLFFCLNNMYNAFFLENFSCVQYAFMYVEVELFLLFLWKANSEHSIVFIFALSWLRNETSILQCAPSMMVVPWYYVKNKQKCTAMTKLVGI